jgi:hypothetical protein
VHFGKVRRVVQILTIFFLVCSCGHRNGNHQGDGGKGNTSARKKMEAGNDCSWDADSLDGKKSLR